MVIYSVGYVWADMCNNPIFVTDLVTDDFNKALVYIEKERAKGSVIDYAIKKWLNEKVIGEYVVTKDSIEPVKQN